MEIIKNEYKIIKDKDYIGKRFGTYTIEKTIIYANGKTETRLRSFIPIRDGNINKVNLDDLYFPITITHEEMKQLPEKYNKAWIEGTLTKEMSERMQELVLLMRAKTREENKKKVGVK